jgi:hypothetical protein
MWAYLQFTVGLIRLCALCICLFYCRSFEVQVDVFQRIVFNSDGDTAVEFFNLSVGSSVILENWLSWMKLHILL